MGTDRRKTSSVNDILGIIEHGWRWTPDALARLLVIRHGDIVLVTLDLVPHVGPMAEHEDGTWLDLHVVTSPYGPRAPIQYLNIVAFAPTFQGASKAAQTCARDENVYASLGIPHDRGIDSSPRCIFAPIMRNV